MNRPGLIVLQVVGALSILPYPFVLLANIMSLAAPGQTLMGAVPFLLLSLYPLVWIALYVFSWRAMARGAPDVAFLLSSIPVLACIGLAGVYAYGLASMGSFGKGEAEEVRKRVEPVNPLLWTIWRTGGEHRFPGGPSVPVEQAIREVDAHPERVNVGVPPYGTPLQMAVMNLSINLDGSPIGPSNRQDELMRLVRALVAHGARFGANEQNNLRQQWMLRRALYDGAITTASENPLVWRILTRRRDGVTPFSLKPDETPLLNTTTRLHGTPLCTALLQDAPDLYPELIKAGAHLSAEEERDLAAAGSLAHVFEHDLELRNAYAKAR